MRVILVLGTVSCLIGLSWETVNTTCPTKTCDAQNEVCENGYCKIKIEGTCTVDQTTPTATTSPKDKLTTVYAATAKASPPTVKATSLLAKDTSSTAKETTPQAKETLPTARSTQTIIPSTAPAPATQPPPPVQDGRKRRDAVTTTMPPMTNTQECVANSLCTGNTALICQCKNGYAKDEKGFCQQADSSASDFRMGLFTSLMAFLFFYISL